MGSKYSSDILIQIQGMKERADNIIEKAFERFGYREYSPMSTWQPTTDVYETENSYIIQMEIPGVDREDVDIELKDNKLMVCGEKRLIKEASNCSYLILERSYGPFARSFSLPQDIDKDGIRASLNMGLLIIRIPKKDIEPEEVKISIQVDD